MSLKTGGILKQVPAVSPDAETVRKALEGVLKSSGFARNERLSRFLSFVVEQHLQGRSQELKESVLGAEVFGRQPGYNPKFDPVVRTEARRLRARLAEYYIGAGAESAIVIDLPKGGYVPVIRPATRPELKPCRQEHLGRRIGKWVVATALVATAAVLIAAAGGVRLGPGRHSRAVANSAAYDTYLRARASEIRPAVTGVELSIELFEQAIAKDRFFAPAYAGLAAMEAARSAFDRFSPSERAAMIAKGWAAAEKAIQLNAAISDAHDALGMMQARSAQWPEAERSFRRAIQISPRDVLWRDHFAMFLLMPLGRIEEAIEQLRSAEEIDPRAPEVHYALSLALRAVRRFDEGDFHCSQAAQDEQEMSGCWAETLIRQGKADDAVRVVEAAWNGHLLRMGAEALGVAYARAGRRADAERMAATLPRPACKAVIFAALGDKERALKVLDQMIPMGPTRVGRDLIAPEYAVLKGDGRLAAIRKKTGLPE